MDRNTKRKMKYVFIGRDFWYKKNEELSRRKINAKSSIAKDKSQCRKGEGREKKVEGRTFEYPLRPHLGELNQHKERHIFGSPSKLLYCLKELVNFI
jgi:hypothetical protein